MHSQSEHIFSCFFFCGEYGKGLVEYGEKIDPRNFPLTGHPLLEKSELLGWTPTNFNIQCHFFIPQHVGLATCTGQLQKNSKACHGLGWLSGSCAFWFTLLLATAFDHTVHPWLGLQVKQATLYKSLPFLSRASCEIGDRNIDRGFTKSRRIFLPSGCTKRAGLCINTAQVAGTTCQTLYFMSLKPLLKASHSPSPDLSRFDCLRSKPPLLKMALRHQQ